MADSFEVNEAGYSETFESRDGPTGRDLSRRATRVQLAAKAQAGVRTGGLKRDITKAWAPGGKNLMIRVGSAKPHALMHHTGTRAHVIRPRQAKALRFMNKQGDVVFARQVMHPGTRANEYLTDNLPLALD